MQGYELVGNEQVGINNIEAQKKVGHSIVELLRESADSLIASGVDPMQFVREEETPYRLTGFTLPEDYQERMARQRSLAMQPEL